MNFFKRLFSIKEEQECKPTSEELDHIVNSFIANYRKASIAQVGNCQPPDDPLASWFCGRGVKLPSEDIPLYDGLPLFPLLQVNCAELPFRPPELAKTAFLVVWFNNKLDVIYDAPNGESWLVREYPTLDGLAPVERCQKPKFLKSCPITWTLSEIESPCWDEVEGIIDFGTLSRESISEADTEYLMDRFTCHEDTKIGGYPALIQYELSISGSFVFQIGSENEVNLNMGDGGTLYFLKNDRNEWVMDFQCY